MKTKISDILAKCAFAVAGMAMGSGLTAMWRVFFDHWAAAMWMATLIIVFLALLMSAALFDD